MIVLDSNKTNPCFWCGKDVHTAHIERKGYGTVLYLHFFCSMNLGSRLIRNAKRYLADNKQQ